MKFYNKLLTFSIGGFIMRYSVESYKNIALFQPVINGI